MSDVLYRRIIKSRHESQPLFTTRDRSCDARAKFDQLGFNVLRNIGDDTSVVLCDYARAYAIRRIKKNRKKYSTGRRLIVYAKVDSISHERSLDPAAGGMSPIRDRGGGDQRGRGLSERETIINFRERSVSPHLASPLRLAADRNVMRAWRFICHCRSSFRATCRRHGAPRRERTARIVGSPKPFSRTIYSVIFVLIYIINRERDREF